jgi:hypothetical protein
MVGASALILDILVLEKSNNGFTVQMTSNSTGKRVRFLCGYYDKAEEYLEEEVYGKNEALDLYDEASVPQSVLSNAVMELLESSDKEPINIFSNSEIIHDTIRLAVVQGKISHENVEVLMFTDTEVTKLQMTEAGVYNKWPKGFFDTGTNLLSSILKLSLKKYKEKKDVEGN